jgi:hypothetical protein
MSYTTKAKGYRSITVEGVRYRWRFVTGKDKGTVTLQGDDPSGQQAIVTSRSWSDPWLSLSDGKAKAFAVAPKLVRELILLALAKGWKPGKRGKTFKCEPKPSTSNEA